MKTWLLSKDKKKLLWIVGLVAAGSLVFPAYQYFKTRDTPFPQDLAARTLVVKIEDLPLEITANGIVQPVRKINLSPEDAGRIVKLYINEGDWVVKGQIIARLNSARLQAQIDQYRALLVKSEFDLQQKLAGNRPEEINQGKARLDQAEANLIRIRQSFPQEIAEARAQIASVHAKYNLANARLIRYRKLEQEGAIALDKLNELETESKTATADLQVARTKLTQLQSNRQQEIVEQQALITQAKESLRLLEKGYRSEEIAQAEAQVAQAKAQLNFYRTQLNDTLLRAPFDAIVSRRFAQEGDFITPTTAASTGEGATSTSVAELSSGVEIEAKISEANIAKIYLHQAVKIQVDAYPDRTFLGRVYLIAPRAIQENNITFFRVKVSLENGQTQLKSGMNVKLTLVGKTITKALTIPLTTIVTQPDGQTGVYLVDDQAKIRFMPIRIGSVSSNRVQVLAGLKLGDRVSLTPPSDQKIEGVDSVNMGY